MSLSHIIHYIRLDIGKDRWDETLSLAGYSF